jgi:hypothetical protein
MAEMVLTAMVKAAMTAMTATATTATTTTVQQQQWKQHGIDKEEAISQRCPAPLTQERFYPRGGWRKVFNRCKDLVFGYLLLSDLFPLQEKFLIQIDTFLLESVAYVEHELMLQLPISKWCSCY